MRERSKCVSELREKHFLKLKCKQCYRNLISVVTWEQGVFF